MVSLPLSQEVHFLLWQDKLSLYPSEGERKAWQTKISRNTKENCTIQQNVLTKTNRDFLQLIIIILLYIFLVF